MRLLSYYALHSLVNQLKKIFKTWVLIFFVVCFLIGGLIGGGAAVLSDVAEEQASTETVTEDYPDGDEAEEDSGPLFTIRGEDATDEFVELLVGGAVLAVFLFQIISADKNGSKIFLPADVNLLFASPMKPQSVLMFRLMTQLGTALMASVYFAFQIPNLVLNMGLDIWSALAMILTWCLTIAVGKLIQVLCYTVSSTYVNVKKYLRKGAYAFAALVAGCFLIYSKTAGLDYFEAAAGFFNHEATRWVPFWGWMKGFLMYAMEGNTVGSLVCLVALIAGSTVLTVVIWKLKADFYEDAMAKSEETAQLLEVAQAEQSTGFVKRKKDRSEKLRRDSMKHGSGANVFFFKVMYNRFRFAHFGVLTKTTETYIVAAVGVAILCKFILQTEGLLPVVLTLGVFSFFRSLGNPIEEDTTKDFFRMVPAPMWEKLFWSVLGGTVSCVLDLLPAMLLASVVLLENPLSILVWLPCIASIDFYASTVGAFINLSVPVSAGKMVKQLVQVMFIYFGLLPDIAIMAVGIIFGQTLIAAFGTFVLNLGLGFIFLVLTPLFLVPKERPVRPKLSLSEEDLAQAQKVFSVSGLSCFAILGVATVLQIAAGALFPKTLEQPWGVWVLTFVPIYAAAIPVGLLMLRSLPVKPLEKRDWKPKQMCVISIICMFMMYGGNLLGNLITMLIGMLKGETVDAAIMGYAMDDSLLLKILVMVILAPILEELVFRKQLIDRMNPYGGKLAVVTSALMFGLFHGNLTQFFYAFGLGLVFGYVYLKSGKLRYSIGLHMGINFLGSVLAPALLNGIDMEALGSAETMNPDTVGMLLSPAVIAYYVYVILLIVLAIVGLVLLCLNLRKVQFAVTEKELPANKWLKVAYLNWGMVLFIVGCGAMVVLSLL